MKVSKVFLSYDRKDGKLVDGIRADLQAAGFEVWDPAVSLPPAENWALEVGKALKQANAMIVLLSPAALGSEHVRQDIEYALSDARFKGRLLPVIIRPVKDIPWILETLPVQVLRIESDPERGRRRVVEALRRIQTAA